MAFNKEQELILKHIYEKVLTIKNGDVADYIPALANVNEDLFALSACDTHGNLIQFGDSNIRFGLQSTSKPISYAIACELYGSEHVHHHVGYEPSGQSFNNHSLNDDGLPHNPLINSGAIMISKLISDSTKDPSQKLDTVINYFTRASGNIKKVGYEPIVFLSEKEHADRNVSLAYYMREKGAYGKDKPSHSDITEALDLYFRCCTLTINSDMGAVIAATLANGGVCPITGERVFKQEIVTNCLTLMFSCGMYNYSGQFIFEVGLPAKSGVSGAILLVIPNKMGVCIYSPRLDKNGNSVRGIECCKMISKQLKCHLFHDRLKSNAKLNIEESHDASYYTSRFISAASSGDLKTCKTLLPKIEGINIGDYDRRTALHLAAAEGQVEVVKFLIENGADPEQQDRWGNTAKSEAMNAEHNEVLQCFEHKEIKKRKRESPKIQRIDRQI